MHVCNWLPQLPEPALKLTRPAICITREHESSGGRTATQEAAALNRGALGTTHVGA